MSKDTGGPAFPSIDGLIAGTEADEGNYTTYGDNGMTLRDHFAGLAMQGALAGALSDGSSLGDNSAAEFAVMAYRFADAMIAERGK